jgi:hypothetical protein
MYKSAVTITVLFLLSACSSYNHMVDTADKSFEHLNRNIEKTIS